MKLIHESEMRISALFLIYTLMKIVRECDL